MLGAVVGVVASVPVVCLWLPLRVCRRKGTLPRQLQLQLQWRQRRQHALLLQEAVASKRAVLAAGVAFVAGAAELEKHDSNTNAF